MFYLLYIGLEHVYHTLLEGKRSNENNKLFQHLPTRVSLTTRNGTSLKNDNNSSKTAAEQIFHRVEAGV